MHHANKIALLKMFHHSEHKKHFRVNSQVKMNKSNSLSNPDHIDYWVSLQYPIKNNFRQLQRYKTWAVDMLMSVLDFC